MDFNSTEHPITWFRDRYRDGTLQIKPPYQRKPVWAPRQKCYLIESILLGLPVPEIYIQHITSAEGQTTYAIVDGQQRVRTVLQFIGTETDPDQEEYNKFPLDKLEPQSPLKNLTFAGLDDILKKKFYGYKFAVRYLNTDSDEDVRDMFKRLNKFLTPLKPQELRNATYSGPFVQLALKFADDKYWAVNGIVTPAAIRRMTDVEYISELIIGVLHGPQGGSSAVIDDYYHNYENFEEEFPEQKAAEQLFGQVLATIQKIFPNIKETRWSNKTDCYTLFVAIASLLRDKTLATTRVSALRKDLLDFANQVDRRLADENAKVSNNAIRYVRAVEKGANDKKRRADRQAALLKILKPYIR
jgi:hypothetical protein